MSATPSSIEPKQTASGSKNISRRDFLAVAGKMLLAASGIVGLGELASFLGYQPDPAPPTRFDLGPATQYPAGSRSLVPEAQAVLLHTPNGFNAISLVCPHLGCTLEMKADAFICPCHGSKFTPHGALINGGKPTHAHPACRKTPEEM
jgi:cytochrome b6-f complex iron-sulfur subunit